MTTDNKIKQLAVQFLRYFGVALVGYIFDFGLLIFCKQVLHLHYLLAATVGFTVGLSVTYVLSNKFVFGESKLKSKKADFIAFALIGIFGLGVLNLLMWLLTGGFHINYIVSKIAATVIVYLWNFFARRALYKN